jgi:probable phosphoglycerate mutase
VRAPRVLRRMRSSVRAAAAVLCCVGVLETRSAPLLSAQSAPVLKVYLARHGQTDWNLEHRLQGSADIPLNATGRQQAAELAQRLSLIHLDAVYSSALRRSRDTAEIVRGSAPLTPLIGLNERHLGKFEGRRTDATDPETANEYERRSQDADDPLDGGESLTQFFERVQTTVAKVLAQHESGAILIIGHGATNQMIVRALLGLSAAQAHGFEQANDDLYLLEVVQGKAQRVWKFVELGRPTRADLR